MMLKLNLVLGVILLLLGFFALAPKRPLETERSWSRIEGVEVIAMDAEAGTGWQLRLDGHASSRLRSRPADAGRLLPA